MALNYWTSVLLSDIKSEGMPAPVTEHRFHPIRRWRFDLAYPDRKIAIEVHGSVYARGHHTRGKGFEDDREKTNEAQLMGWTVLEYSTGQVKAKTPILDLKRAMAS